MKGLIVENKNQFSSSKFEIQTKDGTRYIPKVIPDHIKLGDNVEFHTELARDEKATICFPPVISLAVIEFVSSDFGITSEGVGTITNLQNDLDTYRTGTSITSNTLSNNFLYSNPVIIDTIINIDSIEVVYKRQYLVSNNYGMPHPEIYKEIYSRTDGTMIRENGKYIPAQDESYEF
jgi:hypothetical protein